MGMKEIKILNQPTSVQENRKNNRFWNFINKDDETAELQLFGEITSEESWWDDDCVSYRNFIDELNGLGDKKNINVIIQSIGGDVFAANAIYNALILNKATITGTIIGICASAATIILMACKNRRIAKNAMLMVHNPSVSLWGSYTAEDILKLGSRIEKAKKSIAAAYMERIDKTEDEINQLMDQESWYVGQEAVDAGFCDEVIETGFEQNGVSNCTYLKGVQFSFKNYLETVVPTDVRKKVLALSVVQPKESRTFFDKKTEKGSNSVEEKTIENMTSQIMDAAQLRNAYPEFVNQIVAEAVKSEQERLKSIDEIAAGIPEDVLTKAKYEEPVSAADLALAQMKANNRAGQQILNSMVEDMTDSGANAVGSMPNAGTSEAEERNIQSRTKVNGLAAALGKDKRREKR